MLPNPSRTPRCHHGSRPRSAVALLLGGLLFLGGLPFLGGTGCQPRRLAEQSPARKIHLKLDALDPDGLVGPPGGLRAVSYEFCIPDRRDYRAEVYRIDPSVEFMPGSRGSAGCGPGELLCVGSTQQPDYRAVLNGLASLKYVARIEEWTGE